MVRLLDLRVEYTAPLRTAYYQAIEALNYGYKTLRQREPLDAADLRAVDEHMRAATRAHADFAQAAQGVVGVQFERDLGGKG